MIKYSIFIFVEFVLLLITGPFVWATETDGKSSENSQVSTVTAAEEKFQKIISLFEDDQCYSKHKGVIMEEGTNLRDSPSLQAKVITTFDTGTIVHILEKPKLDHNPPITYGPEFWYKVVHDGQTGYVYYRTLFRSSRHNIKNYLNFSPDGRNVIIPVATRYGGMDGMGITVDVWLACDGWQDVKILDRNKFMRVGGWKSDYHWSSDSAFVFREIHAKSPWTHVIDRKTLAIVSEIPGYNLTVDPNRDVVYYIRQVPSEKKERSTHRTIYKYSVNKYSTKSHRSSEMYSFFGSLTSCMEWAGPNRVQVCRDKLSLVRYEVPGLYPYSPTWRTIEIVFDRDGNFIEEIHMGRCEENGWNPCTES